MNSWQRKLNGARLWRWSVAIATATATVGFGTLAEAQVETSSQPGVYYSWRALQTTVEQCLQRSQQALSSENVGEIQQIDNSVAGRTDSSTVVFVCLPQQTQSQTTTVMMIVAGQDDQAAIELRAALQAAF